MNTADVIKYGHTFLLDSLDRVPQDEWQPGGVCGVWSVKDIVAHLAACEIFLGDLLAAVVAGEAADFGAAMGAAFGPDAVEARAATTASATLAEYQRAFERVAELVGRVDAETLRRPGTLPWYGEAYALDDFVVYSFYGHKREHGAQIAAWGDRLAT